MGPPPTKRRRKLVVLSSEDEEDSKFSSDSSTAPIHVPENDINAQAIPTRLRPQHGNAPRTAKVPTRKESSPALSPKKSKTKRSTGRKDARTTSLDAYFGVGDDSRITGKPTKQTSKLRTASEEGDYIEDDSLDDESRKVSVLRTAPSQRLAEKAPSSRLPTGSQVFRKEGNDVRGFEKDQKAAAALRYDDTRPWADRYGPTSLEELVVHKKKVADVRECLESVYYSRSTKVCANLNCRRCSILMYTKRLLVLKGPSGVGKTATIFTLARAMDLDVLDWKNPTVSDFASGNYVSISTQFEEFLGRSSKFSSLQTSSNEYVDASRESPSPTQGDLQPRKKLVLVEEFPNISTSDTTSVQSFRASVLRYLTADQARKHGPMAEENNTRDTATSLVMIITESHLDGVATSIDSFTAHRLLGADILNHPSTDVIEFNPVAPTYIAKALEIIIQKEVRDSGRRRVLGLSAIKRLSEAGDVRNAIGSLEFICLKNQDGKDFGGKLASNRSRGAKNAVALTQKEEESLELVSQREASLGLFHAVGKVVYNKRDGECKGQFSIDSPTQPPDHLPQHVRLRRPDVSADDLINETGTDAKTFIAALHENYVTSCACDAFTDTLNACIEYLSDTDVLISEKGGRYRGSSTFQGIAMDSPRQDEISFQVAVRGLLFSLPYPVKRAALPPGMAGRNGGKGDTFKMFYPTSVRLGKQAQETEELVERYMRRQAWGCSSANTFGGGYAGRIGDEVVSRNQETAPWQSEQDDVSGTGAYVTPSKDAMVLEMLPYAALIARHRPGSTSAEEELRQITSFTGSIRPITEESPDEMNMKRPASEKNSERLPMKPVARANSVQPLPADGRSQSLMGIEPAASHLYLSDDDIED